MRCFVALGIDDAARRAITAVVERLRAAADSERHRITWARPAGWHVTLKFLGEVAAERLADIRAAITAASGGVGRFEMLLHGVAGFPRQRARVLAVGVDDGGVSAVLARRIDAAMTPIGFVPDEKPFSPHLTVARLRTPAAARFAAQAAREYAATPFGRVAVEGIGFYESETDPDGARYRLIEEFPLTAN